MSKYQLNVEELRARLNARRLARQLSWNALAIAMGVDRNVLARLVHKGRAPNADSLVSMLAYLELEVSLVTMRTREQPAQERAEPDAQEL